MRAEVDALGHATPTPDDLPELPYTAQVLHEALVPIWTRRDARTLELAAALLPDAARALPDFPVIVDTLVTLFHGEAVDRFLRIDAAAEQRRMQWLLTQLARLMQDSRSEITSGS